jgi:hypothetical protein
LVPIKSSFASGSPRDSAPSSARPGGAFSAVGAESQAQRAAFSEALIDLEGVAFAGEPLVGSWEVPGNRAILLAE